MNKSRVNLTISKFYDFSFHESYESFHESYENTFSLLDWKLDKWALLMMIPVRNQNKTLPEVDQDMDCLPIISR